MGSTLIFVLLGAIAMLLLFVVSEFHHHQNGRSTWRWVRRLYRALGAGRVRW